MYYCYAKSEKVIVPDFRAIMIVYKAFTCVYSTYNLLGIKQKIPAVQE